MRRKFRRFLGDLRHRTARKIDTGTPQYSLGIPGIITGELGIGPDSRNQNGEFTRLVARKLIFSHDSTLQYSTAST
jgi:hypothetical protein